MPSHDWKAVEPQARGQWRDILTSLAGLTDRELSGKHGPCPGCGGKDRFRFDDNLGEKGDGGYVCGQCGSGAGINLLMIATGQPFNTAVNAIGDFLQMIPVERFERNRTEAAKPQAPSFSNENREAAQQWISSAKCMPMCELTLRHGIGPDGLMVDGSDIIVPIHASGRGLVNAARIWPDESITYAARGLTYGGATVIGADTGKIIIICVDWFDSWHVYLATGCRVLCCWEVENVHHLAPTIKTEKPVIMACNLNEDELEAAERAGLKVILPKDNLERIHNNGIPAGVERKLLNPSDLLDRWNFK